MWKADEIGTSETNLKFQILENDATITNESFLQLLTENHDFRTFYNSYLIDSGFDAFFWENKPIANSNLNERYECNLINTDYLAGKNPDHLTFDSYFDTDKKVVSFPNLGNDAQLVAPCPVENKSNYTHIGTFIRNAPSDQIHELWKMPGQEMMNHIGDELRWLSTSGLGVFWLHMRIDSVPKYYQTSEYKK
jgi:hypothetical protein